VKLLIDTHVLFWWLTDDKQLTTTAGEAIARPESTVFVSAVSIWETSNQGQNRQMAGSLIIAGELPRRAASRML